MSTLGVKAAKVRQFNVKKLQEEHEQEMNKKADEAGNAGNADSCLCLCSQAQSLRAVCTVVVRNQVLSLLALLECYWYKSTNTDAEYAHLQPLHKPLHTHARTRTDVRTQRQLLVQKYKY